MTKPLMIDGKPVPPKPDGDGWELGKVHNDISVEALLNDEDPEEDTNWQWEWVRPITPEDRRRAMH